MSRLYVFAILTLLTSPLARSQENAITIDVTPGPHALVEARDEVRRLRASDTQRPATIRLAAGRYECSEPLVLEAQDSGIAVVAAPGASPQLVGGTVVADWSPYQGEIKRADVSTVAKRATRYQQLLCGGQRMILARYPNHDASNPLYGGWAFVAPFPKGSAPEGHDWKRMLYVKPQDIRQWAHPEDVEIDIFAQYGWWNFLQPLKSLETTTGLLTLAAPCSYDLHPHNRFHFQNALEELDSPGEWFLDPRTSTLYFWPPQELAQAEVRLITLDTFITAHKTSRVRIERLSFTGANRSAITFTESTNCLVAGCTIDTVGAFRSAGINVTGGTKNTVRANDIHHTGSTGINIAGGDRLTLTPAEHTVLNNHIHHIGVLDKNACGVAATGAGCTIAHNHIHDGPRMGVQLSGNLFTVEYNHLHHLVLETQDGGAIYTGGRDWLGGRGNVWRYNHIHDIIGCGQQADGLKVPWFTFGLYPDDNTGGVDIIGNLVYRVAHSPLHLHNSRDCIVENNIFAFGGAFQFDLHGWHRDERFYKQHHATMVAGYESVEAQPKWAAMRGMSLHP
ncbi:MAG: right-handed parallel beta-helix repeat-containing protein, partial [Roseimicrobium sp.]